MDAFELRRAELLHSSTISGSKNWFVLNAKVCGVRVGKFLSSSPLVANFPTEFATVPLSDLKNWGGIFHDRRGVQKNEEVAIASSFGVVAAILRQKFKEEEKDKYLWLVKAINSLNIETGPKEPDYDVHGAASCDVYEEPEPACGFAEQNMQLKSDIDRASAQLKSLHEEVKNFGQVQPSEQNAERKEDEEVAEDVWTLINDVCDKYQVHLADIIAGQVQNPEVGKMLSNIAEKVVKNNNPVDALGTMLGDSAPQFIQSLRVPDWTLLYFKLQSRIPDQAWQTLLSLTKLGRTGANTDIPVLLNKNQIKALRQMVFSVVRKAMGIRPLPKGAPRGFHINLSAAVSWAARETRLHQPDQQTLEVNLKLDGRPFFGRQQVMIGIVPINVHHASSESCKSVYPIAIANCQENRENVEALIKDLNQQKDSIKKKGIVVDGRRFKVKFTVTLDYKALIMLLKRKGVDLEKNGDGLCKRGLDTECCVFCKVIRGCACPGVARGEACPECFLKSKANIGEWKGLRDDLLFLLEEELCDVNLCALHCELRNTEQLLSSLGMFAYECGSLKNCNDVLKEYGPDSMKEQDRIVVKTKPGQESAIERHNIQVVSFSGATERRFLDHIDEIVTRSLPVENLQAFFNNKDVAETYLLNQVTFCEEMVQYYNNLNNSGKFVRDWGTHSDTVDISDTVLLKQKINSKLAFWMVKQQEVVSKLSILQKGKKYPKDVQNYVAEYQLRSYQDVFCKWREIAETMRQKVFDDNMEEEIDIFDLECKEWGFYLRELFGLGLGTGDYGHLTVEHASMLLRNFRSLRHYSNQGFEAAHKLQKQIFSRATNHDGSGEATSLDQILTHHYAEKLLFLRLCFRNAKECARKGKKFYFRGCGWPNCVSTKSWSATHKRWIEIMDDLFTAFMCKDYLFYDYTEKLCCIVSEADHPRLEYDDTTWENSIKHKMTEREWVENETPRAWRKRKGRVPSNTRRKLFKVRKRRKKRINSNVVSTSSSSTSPKQKAPMSLNLKRKRGSPLSSLTPTQNLSASTSNATTPCIPKSRRCLFELSNRKRKQASSLQTETLNRKPSMTTTPTPCTKGLLSSTASVTATPSSSEALSSESSGILQQVPEQPLFAFTAQRANMKRKANDKKCDGKKFRKMVSDLSVSSDEQSPKQISFHSVSQNPSPSLICQGTFHQGSHSSFHYPGQQCSAIALCALMYSSVRAVDSWDASNVDDILLIGDKIHFDQLCHLKKDPNEDQKLTLDEVPNGVTMLNYTFSNDNREIVAGTIKEKDEPGNDFATLEDAFTKCENENATGLVLRILDYCVACIINSSAWYLIDSHARNSEGMTDERGTAVALKFMSSSDLANHVRRFVTNQRTLSRDTDLSFEALIVKVTRAQCKESEVSVVPKIKLFSLTSSHGTCEIFTTSLCRLEEERKIDDNTIDFVVLHSVDLFLDEDVRDNLFVFNSCFYAKIKQNFNSKSTRNWTKTVNIFEKDFVIIPVCHNDHWILIIIKMVIPVVSVMVLDSANAERVPRENVERTIKRYLEDEWCAKRSSQQDSIQQEFHYPVVPQQTNDTDCGVFLMKNLEEFLKCYPVAGAAWQKWRPVYGQKDVVALRKQIKFLIQKFSYEARQ